MKKIISVVLTVLMLMSVCAMQGSAFTVKLPTVTGVKFVDASPASMKEFENSEKLIEDYIDYIEDELDFEITDYEALESLLGELYNFYVEQGIVEVTLSDSSVVELDLEKGFYEIDRYTDIYVEAYVKYEDYLALKESGGDTVTLTLDCEVYSSISGISKESTFTHEVEVVDCFVKSFKPTSTINYSLYEDSDVLDLEGKKFSVTYADGTKETLTARFDPEEGEYLLGDEHIFILFSDKKVWLGYMDEIYEHSVSFDKENPYKSIEITDYTFSEKEGLTSVSYKIADKNGNSKSFTSPVSVDTEYGLYPALNIIGVYDSYLVCVESEEIIDWDTYDTTGVELYVSIGELYSESVELDYYEKEAEDTRTLLEKIEDIIAGILTVFFNFISFWEL